MDDHYMHADGPTRAHPEAPDEPTLVALGRVLDAHHDGRAVDGRLQEAAQAAAEDAHRRGRRAAEMLVRLKAEWAELVDGRRLLLQDERALLSRLVTLAIQAYYPAADAPRHRAGRSFGLDPELHPPR